MYTNYDVLCAKFITFGLEMAEWTCKKNYLFVILCKILLSQVANTLKPKSRHRGLDGTLVWTMIKVIIIKSQWVANRCVNQEWTSNQHAVVFSMMAQLSGYHGFWQHCLSLSQRQTWYWCHIKATLVLCLRSKIEILMIIGHFHTDSSLIFQLLRLEC